MHVVVGWIRDWEWQVLLLEFVVIWCCVVCGAWCAVCMGLREGRHVMPVAAGVARLLLTRQLRRAMYPVWSCS